MNLKQVALNNTGMQQDLSISKESKDFAYKNLNIRIQATSDGTLASITNIKSPKIVQNSTLDGIVLNSILCNKYIVVFTHTSRYDYIYRIDLEDNCKVNTLYKGDLNFRTDYPIDSTFYYENDNVQKVYWVDGWISNNSNTGRKNNYPRVINIITEGERDGSGFTRYDANTNFDFYPEIGDLIPEIVVTKNFDVPSELPSGIIQYFVSYFNYNKSETLIAGYSSLYTIDLKTRGASADKTGCAFDVTINNVSTDFEYLRIYSVRRTSLNGDITVNIVKDIKIQDDTSSYSVLDNGIGQETLDPSQIFFVGGTPLFAKTLCQKDNTLFVGGIKTEGVFVDDEIKEAIRNTIVEHKDAQDNVILEEARILTETRKTIPGSDVTFNAYYPYKLQKDNESLLYKTFKVGEIYRFGIQFQNKQGQWSEVVWMGDKKIAKRPVYNNDGTFNVSNIRFYTESSTPDRDPDVYPLDEYDLYPLLTDIRDEYRDIFVELKSQGFVNYRLLMADPEYSNGRSILAQGVVCPTMFSPALRAANNPHTISSWIMRPRSCGNVDYADQHNFRQTPCHHLEPLEPASHVNSELSTYDPKNNMVDPASTLTPKQNFNYHNYPFEFIQAGSDTYTKVGEDVNFYIDESIVSLHSPEITNNTIIKGSPKFRIIGMAPLTASYNNNEIETESVGIDLDYVPGINSDIFSKYRIQDSDNKGIDPLYAEYMYKAPMWGSNHILTTLETAYYNIHMWQYSGSIVGFNIVEDTVQYPDDSDPVELPEEPLRLKKNTFYNHIFSKCIDYLDSYKNYPLSFGVGLYGEPLSDGIGFKDNSSYLYYGNLDYLHSNPETQIYHQRTPSGLITQNIVREKSSSITFDSTPHSVFYLGINDNNKLQILPRFNDETLYSGIFTGKYGLNSEWRNIDTDSHSGAERFIAKVFHNKLNAVGSKLGASWIDDFAKYREGSSVDVYDEGQYKTCCVIGVSDISDPTIKGFIANNYTNFSHYNYTETLEGNDYTVAIAADNGGLGPTDTAFIKKCYWPKEQIPYYNSPSDTNIEVADLSEEYLDTAYPWLYGRGFNYVNVWENGDTPQDGYKFIYPFRIWNSASDKWVYKSTAKNVNTFSAFDGEYIYEQDTINRNAPSKPYLFIGELYYDIDYDNLYGGYSKEALNKLNWIPVSKPVPLHRMVNTTEGDTYYQRWDCLKTFPRTEEDINNVVDITSFMVETHINLDDRTDPNRATFNMLSRPSDFNMFNPVYYQKNNLFAYSTINSLLSEENSHQVIWSLTKNFLGTVDTWTNLSAVNTTNLKYPITKLVNFNNKIVGLTEHSVEIVNYNAKNLVPTDNNTFIELKNSSKVDGTVDFSIDKGTTNPSVLVTDSGLYFIEDNENSLMKINYNGEIQNLGTGRMDSWFKDNIIPGNYIKTLKAFHFAYDSKQKDVYIGNDTDVIVYNELLNNFTSFVDLQELLSLYTYKGNTYALAHEINDLTYNDLFELYGGNTYGYGFYGKGLPYSIQYRVNPGPYSDKVFTNIEFRADLDITKVNSSTSNVKPFDTIQAWNEYQDTGVQPLVYDRLNNLRDKFRTWRAVIPRNRKGDKSTWRDRIRNPWVHLKLDKTDVNGQKLEFHNITVTYME